MVSRSRVHALFFRSAVLLNARHPDEKDKTNASRRTSSPTGSDAKCCSFLRDPAEKLLELRRRANSPIRWKNRGKQRFGKTKTK
jgi:hypothetical protein